MPTKKYDPCTGQRGWIKKIHLLEVLDLPAYHTSLTCKFNSAGSSGVANCIAPDRISADVPGICYWCSFKEVNRVLNPFPWGAAHMIPASASTP